jgi:ParB family chromosome partitioning protein
MSSATAIAAYWKTPRVAVDDVKVNGRHRRDLGDLTGLADSMTELGLLHPIVVTEDMRLVAGERRLAAARVLGWSEIEATTCHTVGDAVSMLRAEADENTCRKAFTPTEAESISQSREALLKPLAKQRMSEGGKGVEVPQPLRTDDAAATGLGYSSKTIRKVREIRQLAESTTTPEPVRQAAENALAEMDATGRVDGAHRAVKLAEQDHAAVGLVDAIERRVPGAKADMDRAKVKARYSRGIAAASDVLLIPAEAIAAVISDDELAGARHVAAELTKLVAAVAAHRAPGLRIAGGAT